MTLDEKLDAIQAAVQIDAGGRGLANDPTDNLFTATTGDFTAACQSLADVVDAGVQIVTGFFIPGAVLPAFETDGPLGALFLQRAFAVMGIPSHVASEAPNLAAIDAALQSLRLELPRIPPTLFGPTHVIWLERSGPAADDKHYTMRGRDLTRYLEPAIRSLHTVDLGRAVRIGIGDGGNEIGMGKIPHETIVKNIPNGDQVHCRVPVDHLIVAGVSNWGAYALAAGVLLLRNVTPPAELFDPAKERELLTEMIRVGPLVDGVTGQQTPTVDGLSWDDYTRPLVQIREILFA